MSEKDLEAAGQYLFKDFYDISIKSCRDLHTESEVETTTPDEKYDPVTWQPPPLDLSVSMSEYGLDIYTYVIDSVKCLNMLGILWSSRGRLKGSILFLLGAKSIYASYKKDKVWAFIPHIDRLYESFKAHDSLYLIPSSTLTNEVVVGSETSIGTGIVAYFNMLLSSTSIWSFA